MLQLRLDDAVIHVFQLQSRTFHLDNYIYIVFEQMGMFHARGLCSSIVCWIFFWSPLLLIIVITKLSTDEQTKCRIHMSAGSSAVKDFQFYLFLFFRICSNYQCITVRCGASRH